MQQYLNTLIEEKGISLDQEVGGENDIGLTIEVVVEFICGLPAHLQKKIKDTLVAIDFKNGDIVHYFKYIAAGMSQI